MDSFWEFVGLIFWFTVCMAYLLVMFQILGDLLRDSKLGGGMKAVWVIALIFLPFLTALIYLIARGKGMDERRIREAEDMRRMQEEYIHSAAAGSPSASGAGSPAEQISAAKALLDSGAITQQEFDAMKAKALA
jgi:hypothetical protein